MPVFPRNRSSCGCGRASSSASTPGVYRVGHDAPSLEATYLAAVKACGPSAVLSGCAAAYLLRLIKGKPSPPEVTATTERRIERVKTRRERSLDPRDVMTYMLQELEALLTSKRPA